MAAVADTVAFNEPKLVASEQPDAAWHACLPALTLIPNYFVTGILAILAGLAVLVWAALFVQRDRGGWILILLSLLMLLVGGGFVPSYIGVIAGVAGSQISGPLTWWRACPGNVLRLLASLWPWAAIVLIIWFTVGVSLPGCITSSRLAPSFQLSSSRARREEKQDCVNW